MTPNACYHLRLEYVGRFHAAICRCKERRDCPKVKNPMLVQQSCFDIRRLAFFAAKKPSTSGDCGDGTPTGVKEE